MSPRKTDGMRVEIKEVTPEVAAEWLSHNTSNRPIRRNQVDSLKRDLLQGRWKENGDTIKFDINGVLRDGQHRLLAVTESGRTVRLAVAYDVPEDVMDSLANVSSRSPGDTVALYGYVHGKELAALARLLSRAESKTPFTMRDQTRGELLDEIRKREPLILNAEAYASAARSRFRLMPGSVFGACYYLFSIAEDGVAADDFLRRLGDGTGLDEGSPIHRLRRRLENDSVSHRKYDPIHLVALTIRAWNAWIEGRTIRHLRQHRTGENQDTSFPSVRGRPRE